MKMIFFNKNGLNIRQLIQVYEESLETAGKKQYGRLPKNMQIMEAEQDFYSFIDEFLREPKSFIAVWAEGTCYCAALRMQTYKDGLLLSGLETAPAYRRNGYGMALLRETLDYLSGPCKIYCHIRRDNTASSRLHTKCGFVKISDSAAYIDGTADHRTGTYMLQI